MLESEQAIPVPCPSTARIMLNNLSKSMLSMAYCNKFNMIMHDPFKKLPITNTDYFFYKISLKIFFTFCAYFSVLNLAE